MSQYGIDETKDVVKLLMSVAKGVQKSLADDGKLTFGDLGNFTDAIFKLVPAIQGIEKVPHELKDLDASEVEQLKNLVLAEMPEVGDKWTIIVENALHTIWSVYQIVLALRS
jgi:hypothetical protein